ncbi:MAG TPA: glycosyltransferase family 9 protein [Bryobacteraceae bacterium]|nr:glycosyltransferase family 9 protein [Bryobacteraceae bacterium]
MRRLLIRPGAIGDVLVCLPAMESLRADYTEVWVPSIVRPLIRFADRVERIPAGFDLLGLPETEPDPVLLDRLRSFDSISCWLGPSREEFREQISRLQLPVCFYPALPPADNTLHVVDFFLKQAGAPLGQFAHIPVEPRHHDSIVIHPFSGSVKKNLPLATFRAVAAQLPEPVEWCAGPEEPLAGAVRIPDLYDLACWLAGARLYIGNDAGITHLAAAVGVPVVAVFGPTDPAIWAPRGENVRIIAGNEAGNLETISAEEIVEAALALLTRRENR